MSPSGSSHYHCTKRENGVSTQHSFLHCDTSQTQALMVGIQPTEWICHSLKPVAGELPWPRLRSARSSRKGPLPSAFLPHLQQ